MKELFEKVNKIALDEIEKFGGPSLNHYNLSIKIGEELAKHFKVDVDLVKTGIALMDIKLGECIKNKIQKEHVQKSFEFAKELLENFGVDEKTKKILYNCILAHHGGVPFESLEAEICANADCYRFLHPQGVMQFITTVVKRGGGEQNDFIKAVLAKMEEKHSILSLDICKKELEPYYTQIKTLLLEAQV